jgi:glycosyltransferase involved in cell wall biosynthesis
VRVAARLSRRRPVVVSGQHSITPLSGQWATIAARLTRRLSDRFVVPSQAVHDRLVNTERLPRNRIVLIENGVDTQRYNRPGGEVSRSQLGLDPNGMVVGAVGRLSPEKGLHHLLKGLAILRSHGLLVDLILVGDGPERPRLDLDSRAFGLDGHVKFLGVRRDLPRIYAVMDVFALPSLQEASPMALLEAMAAGRPIVATSVGGVPEILENGRSGLLVTPGCPVALADGLERLTSDSALRHRLGDAARHRVAERFDISHTVERHAQLYRELLTERRSAQKARVP